ncbi:nitroreductase family deazaflavin-dependent oxidoreductase [Streptomyces sp. NBC_00825]|uniref:nitroreductase family deazaflavin-dependent oxidoreductase n=1 Tax=unclassified Streptomyces TaxID=2593676 RepID=UPI00225B38D6|nr:MULTISPECIES: nitroreductase family deazaflavin-dependent oxidoreductase [unclassified Streptomyces]WTB56033.1 nitroreductase family deazaflavin-dependent oxidoreductase [Streptomyces sp. NBC_00826]WTH91085.1 nitroreductase family deazaflavin-dependent oxidoreductase [Streptomyces sp. NBC_00825]WTH99811.1 nitroreductase family deazaflavin-dependent oxidoreductase [Streptomyces sp. NBC_00822]MCX4865275.1 nitroreductase family deazaflavin-dependent oxidoreductase [Streptomyces sp. NBC_00906]M
MAPGVRLVQKVSSTRAFAKVAPHVVPVMDRTVHRLTRGKVLLSARMLPGLILTVPGARSGQLRTTPLACMPEKGTEQSWILVGSNFGRSGHPAWTANLLAGPDRAVVNWQGRDIPVRATLLEGEEREEVWRAALKFWPPYTTYQARVEREIRLFRLRGRDDAAT